MLCTTAASKAGMEIGASVLVLAWAADSKSCTRDTKLRDSHSLSALDALAAAGWITNEQSDSLGTAYQQLRRIEHRLQMIGDNQTHSLPRSDEDLKKFSSSRSP